MMFLRFCDFIVFILGVLCELVHDEEAKLSFVNR